MLNAAIGMAPRDVCYIEYPMKLYSPKPTAIYAFSLPPTLLIGDSATYIRGLASVRN